MTEYIAHRRNTVDELAQTDRKYGVEMDLRSDGEKLIVHHDPLKGGETFESWLDAYSHGTIILNVKEEGLEAEILKLLKDRGIETFFFLDQSFPFLIKWSRLGESRCAVRVSEFESIDTALALAGKVDWVWVDCFSKFPLQENEAAKLRAAGFKLCIVSPELQGRDAQIEIPQMNLTLNELNIVPDAICTKRPDIWEAARKP